MTEPVVAQGLRHDDGGPRLHYNAAIDGFRAIAVMAVVFYHLDAKWAVGGYLGVEVFFVISGFLITALMLAEHQRNDRIDLGNFWIRRARRLLPALYLLIAAVIAFMVFGASDELIGIRDDVVAAVVYVTNWFLSFSDTSYFEALGRPSPLQHLWSLAVEEQWYLLWPVVFSGGLWLAKGRADRLVVPMGLGVLASALLMAVLYDPNVDPSRIYYGTDTRASGLLLGSLLAVVWSPWRLTNRVGQRAPQVLDTAAGVAMLGILVLFWRLSELDAALYRGGFLLIDVLTCVVIAAVVHPAARIAPRILSLPPLVWIGTRSYGIYLWHWPIIVFTRPRLDVTLDGWQLHGLRIALAFTLAELSYMFVEKPIREGALGRWWDARGTDIEASRRGVWIGLAVSIIGIALIVSLVRAQQPEVEVATTDDVAALLERSPTTTAVPTTLAPTTTSAPVSAAPTTEPTTTTTTTTTTVPTTEARLPRSVAVTGDSVGITMAINLPSDLTEIDVDNAGVEGCGVIEGGRLLSGGRGIRSLDACTDISTRWARGASGNELTVVTIGAWEVFDIEIGGEIHALGSARHDALIIDGLTSGVDALLTTGTEVVLMELPCYDPVDGGGLKALPERGDRTRTEHVTSLIRRVAAAYDDGVHVLTPPSEFCTDPAIGSDVNLRWDGVHYGPLGGAFIWGSIVDELLTIPVDY